METKDCSSSLKDIDSIERSRTLVGFFLAFLGTAFFSLKSIFIKLAYAQGLDTNSVLLFRMLISLPVYLVIIAYLHRKKPAAENYIRQNYLFIIFLGFIGYFLASWLDLKGLESISAGLERLTLFTYPIFTAILGAMFFNFPLNKKIVITLIMTYIGLWFVFTKEVEIYPETGITGILLVLGSALSYSFYVLFGKQVITEIGSTWFTAVAMSISSIFVILFYGLAFDFNALSVTNEAWLWLFLLAIVSTVIPSFMLAASIARIGPAQTGIVGTLGPVITILLAGYFLNEIITYNHLIGISLVIGGIMYLTFKPKKIS